MERYSSDFSRDFPVRWLGYCHVVGRVLPYEVAPPMTKLWMSRTTIAYIAVDTIHKAMDNRRPNPALKAADALIWQGLASIYLPALVVGGVSRGSNILMQTWKLSRPMNRFIPLGLVILAMPVFGNSIDRVVDIVLDNTVRPILLH